MYTDTDSLIYLIECNDVYDIMKRDINRFDTSDYAVDNVYGFPLGLRAKMYSMPYASTARKIFHTSRVMFNDESLFTREGIFNSHNMHLWSDENPTATQLRSFQIRWKRNLKSWELKY